MKKEMIYKVILSVVALLIGVGAYFNHRAEAAPAYIALTSFIYGVVLFVPTEFVRYNFFAKKKGEDGVTDSFRWLHVVLGVAGMIAGTLLSAVLW